MNYCLLDLEDVDPNTILSQEIEQLENNIKKIITVYIREDKKKVKRTSTIKVVEKKIKMKKSVYERRKNLKKFGLATNEIDNKAITTYGNKIYIEKPESKKEHKFKPIEKKENKLLFKDRKKLKNTNFNKKFVEKKVRERYVPISKRHNDKYSICVTNIPEYYTDNDFLDLGRKYGRVIKSKLLKSYDNPKLNRGIGFLHYTKEEDMQFAIFKLKNQTIDHLILNAEKAKSKKVI